MGQSGGGSVRGWVGQGVSQSGGESVRGCGPSNYNCVDNIGQFGKLLKTFLFLD